MATVDGWRGVGEGRYSFLACLSYLTIDHASLSRRSAPSLLLVETSNLWTLLTFFPLHTLHRSSFCLPYPIFCFRLFCGRHLIPWDSDRLFATIWCRARQKLSFFFWLAVVAGIILE